MRWRRSFIPTIASVALLVVVAPAIGGQAFDARRGAYAPSIADNPAIEDRLLVRMRRARPTEKIPVIVTNSVALQPSAMSDVIAPSRRQKLERIVRHLKDQAEQNLSPIEDEVRLHGATHTKRLWIANGVATKLSPAAIEELTRRPNVGAIKLDAVVAKAPITSNVFIAPATNLTAVNAPAMWDLGFAGQGRVVAILDTGVDGRHDDLRTRYRGGNNSWFDPYSQYATPEDPDGHGTAVASVVVGGDAGGSSIGVAPFANWIAARVFNDAGDGTVSGIHAVFQWILDPDHDPATDDAPDLVNASWNLVSAIGECDLEFAPDIQQLRAAGIAVVFSAGNDGPNAATSSSPANNPGAFSVGAVDASYAAPASFSSRGPSPCAGVPIYPRVVAPGVDIKAADITFGGVFAREYIAPSGTSFAAPHVSGAMALLLSAFPNLPIPIDYLENAIEQTALDLTEIGRDPNTGHGKIDVLAAYNWLVANPPPRPPPSEQPPDPVVQNATLVKSITYNKRRRLLTVTAINPLKGAANLVLVGYGAMVWDPAPDKQHWQIKIRTTTLPATLAIAAPQGLRTFSTATGQ